MSEISNPSNYDKPSYRRGSEDEADEVPGGFQNFSTSLISMVDYAANAMCLRPYCDPRSPIEVFLGTRLLTDLKLQLALQPQSDCWTLIPQWWTQNFRFDFAIAAGMRVVLLIECDGREFHSTPQQIDRDRRKDAEAAMFGWPVFRFTGSDINQNLAGCVERVRAFIR